MHLNLLSLSAIAQKRERLIIGLMSGTSMDGLDVALCKISGSDFDTQLELIAFETFAYPDSVRNKIKKVFPKETVSLLDLTLLHKWLGQYHGEWVNTALLKWGISSKKVDLIASHGQTIFHAPNSLHHQSEIGNATLQIGDADQLAVTTGIITLSDFRQKHIAGGGEGAPLAVYGDALLFGNTQEPVLLLNIGGIANYTYLPARNSSFSITVTDTGPGNTLMDAFVQKYFPPLSFDLDSQLANRGVVQEEWLHLLLDHPFFTQPIPKSTGQEVFNLDWVEKTCGAPKTEKEKLDLLATLNQLSALTIAQSIQKLPDIHSIKKIHLSGGGIHNPLLIKNLSRELSGISVLSLSNLGMNPDAKEAILFAILANQTIAKGGFSLPGLPTLSLGKISFPQ